MVQTAASCESSRFRVRQNVASDFLLEAGSDRKILRLFQKRK
jgi:hypothetical protein